MSLTNCGYLIFICYLLVKYFSKMFCSRILKKNNNTGLKKNLIKNDDKKFFFFWKFKFHK